MASVEVDVSRDVRGIEIILSPGATVRGCVLERDGSTAPGALVALAPAGSGPRSILVSRQEIAGAEGRFMFEGVSPGAYELQAIPKAGSGSRPPPAPAVLPHPRDWTAR